MLKLLTSPVSRDYLSKYFFLIKNVVIKVCDFIIKHV